MANVADTLLERHLRNTAFAFVTSPAPTDTTPKYVAGSNLMTSFKNYTERRPGFDVGLEPTPTTFTDPIVRTFCWRRWGGNFYIMLCTTNAVANIWKLAIGLDASFVNIWASTSPEPFDFVVSNNFCFFGNGTDMKKFDGTTVTKWGISSPSVVAGTPTAPTVAADVAVPGASAWTNPNNILLNDGNFATVTTAFGNPVHVSDLLEGTTYGFAIPATATIAGIQVDIKGKAVGGGISAGGNVQLLKAGTPVGIAFSGSFSSTNAFVTYGGATNLWGSTWTPADINAANFGAAFQALGHPIGFTVNWSIDFMRITIFYSDTGTGAPTTSLGGTGISATNGGYQYVYCYMNSTTGHISSPSPPSASTGNFANKTVTVNVIASADPQVDKIRIFRTTDGGGGIFFEIAGGPFANATTGYPDTTTDANLSLITAPTFGFNDPPPNMKGMVWFANRIWGFNNATLYFTDWEEMNIGVPEVASVSGPAGNFWNFSSEITGLSVAQDGVLIFLAGGIFKIDGDSLDTFRRTVIAQGLGCRQRATITRLGGLTAFLANTNSIWTTDSSSLTEISQMIQPTLDNIDHSQASMCFHLQGQYRWLMLCDQGHSQSLAYDVNNQQWMPPWTIVGQGLSSGETTPGNWTLLIGQQTSNKMLQMVPGQYTDNGSTYAMSGTTNLIPIISEHLSSGSPIIDLFYPQAPGHVAYMEYVGFDFNNILPSDVLYELDDDPTGIGNIAILASDNFNRVQNPINTNWKSIALAGMVLGQANGTQYIGQNAAATDMLYDGGTLWPNNHFSQATLKTLNTGKGFAGLYVRGTVSPDGINFNGYQFLLDGTFGTGGIGAPTGIKLFKHVGTVGTLLQSSVITPLSGDIFKFQATGSQLEVFQNNVPILSATDSDIASGKPGILASPTSGVATDVAWDDWSAGSALFTSIFGNMKDVPLRAQGLNILNKWFYARKPTGQRVSIQFNYVAANNNPKIYTMSIAYRVYR